MPEAGFHQSNCSAVRFSPTSERMPDMSGGCGRCTGLGSTSATGIEKNSPSYDTGSGPQQAFIASMSSPARRPRVRGSTSYCACSSSDQPTLKPNTVRPPDSTSSVVIRCARSTGRWYPATRMLVPRMTSDVHPATTDSSSSGCSTERYASGTARPGRAEYPDTTSCG